MKDILFQVPVNEFKFTVKISHLSKIWKKKWSSLIFAPLRVRGARRSTQNSKISTFSEIFWIITFLSVFFYKYQVNKRFVYKTSSRQFCTFLNERMYEYLFSREDWWVQIFSLIREGPVSKRFVLAWNSSNLIIGFFSFLRLLLKKVL